jgi:hypothetical protein
MSTFWQQKQKREKERVKSEAWRREKISTCRVRMMALMMLDSDSGRSMDKQFALLFPVPMKFTCTATFFCWWWW